MGADELPLVLGAVMVASRFAEVYNRPVGGRDSVASQRLERKMSDFSPLISEDCQLLAVQADGQSAISILDSSDAILQRYACVFRESGESLKMTTLRRFFMEARTGVPGG